MNGNDKRTLATIEETANEPKIVKIAITEDLYRKIKAFGVLIDDNKNESILLGNAINKLYECSKESISKEFL